MIHLGLGQPDFKTPQHVVDAAKKALDEGHHGYVLSNGILECRQAVTRKIKKLYNSSPKLGKTILEILYSLLFCVATLVRLKNPVTEIRNYQSHRGMDFMTDVRDWLGGYPYEFASTDEVINFMKSHFPRFKLINLQSASGTGNNWFLFSNTQEN